MTTPYEIPLTPEPQRFTISLGSTSYALTVKWNAPHGAWMLDIAMPSGTLVLGGIPLVTGVDLLGQYAYLGFTEQLVCQSDFDLDAVPTFENLGTQGHLYFLVG